MARKSKSSTRRTAARTSMPRHTPQKAAGVSSSPAALHPAPPSFASLPRASRRRVYRGLISALRVGGMLGRGRYDAVTGDQDLRARFAAETGGEETALTVQERNRLIALVRHLDRNSEHLNGFLKQLDLNVVGTSGGKATFAFPAEYADSARTLRDAFGAWARECEFFDGVTLQRLLKLAIRTKFVTGRAVLLFDDGIVCDSGRVIMFEGDNIANIPAAEFAARYPKDWSQHQGLIKNGFGQTVGVFCSFSQRGVSEFPRIVDDRGRLAVWGLVKPDAGSWLSSPFTIFQNLRRVNQIAAAPCVSPSVGSIMDLEALAKYELQSAKKISQTVATVTQEAADPSAGLSDGLDGACNPPLADDVSDADLAAAVSSAADGADDDVLDLPEIAATGAIYDVLPPGLKMELLNPTHPNANVIGMVTWIKQNASWANGIAGLFATGKADSSYSASLVEQAITWPCFEEEQQELKTGVLDWIIRRWYVWAVRKGHIPADLKLPPEWLRYVAYSFPRKREPDAQKEQSAITQGLRNLTLSYEDLYGPDWRDVFARRRAELDAARENGIPHPALFTASGQAVDDAPPAAPAEPKQKEDE